MVTRKQKAEAKKQFQSWKNKLKATIDKESGYELHDDGTMTLIMSKSITKTVWSGTMIELQKTIKEGSEDDLIEAMNKFAKVMFDAVDAEHDDPENYPNPAGAFVTIGALRRAMFLIELMHESGFFERHRDFTDRTYKSLQKSLDAVDPQEKERNEDANT